jgi:hypothetical protein
MKVGTQLQIEKCKLKNTNWGSGCLTARSSLLAPRSALSLTEVLIAMGILTLGLLGVASVFPVGSYYMQQADIKNQGSAIAQSVMSDIMARGMLNPRAWYVMVPPSPYPPNLFFTGIDGKYTGLPQPATSTNVAYTFTRPFGEALAAELQTNPDITVLAKQFGHAYVIDPMFAAAAANSSSSKFNITAYAFPATAYAKFPWTGSTYYGTRGWDPWRASGNINTNEKTWPIRRVTFQQSNGWPLDKTMAESLFRGNDDLTTDLPARDDRPAKQNWDIAPATGTPLARQWTGDYSWIVSVVPSTNAARDGMARNPEGFAYDVSVVVFYKRVLPGAVPAVTADLQDAAATERMVGAKILSTGMNGGELLLTDMGDVTDVNKKNVSPFDQLKAGQWIMLCGPHPNSNVVVSSTTSIGEPRFVLNWYQVLSIEGKDSRLNYDGTDNPPPPASDPDRRLITVRGPEWPWQPRSSYISGPNSDTAKLSDDLCVGIFRGAVAVHTKTMRLESGSSSTMRLTIPGKITPPQFQ